MNRINYRLVLDILRIIALFAAYMAAYLITGLGWAIFAGIDNFPYSLESAEVQLQIISIALFLYLLRRFYRKRGWALDKDFLLLRNDFTHPKWLALCVLGGATLNLLVVLVLNLLPDALTAGYAQRLEFLLTGSTPFFVITAVLVAAPIIEEMLFRGFALRVLSLHFRSRNAAVFLSLIFGLTHMQPIWTIYTAGFALGLSWITVRTGSIIPAIVVHMSFNAMSLFLFFS